MTELVTALPSATAVRGQNDLTGRVALITGAGSGLGRAMAWGLACHGANIAIVDRDAAIAERCASCHATSPTQAGFSSPPAGVVLTSPEQIRARAADLKRVVASRSMPLGNVTGMTDEERALVVAWVDQGAATER